MDRPEKHEFVATFQQQVKDAPLMVVAGYEGTSANSANRARRILEPSGVRFRVVKNTLARRALQGTDREALVEHFQGMTLVLLTGDDPIGGAKALKEAMGVVKTIEIRAGHFEGSLLDAQGVKAIASLPSREELLVQLLRTIQEPARRVLSMLQAPARDLMDLLKNYEEKLSEEDGE